MESCERTGLPAWKRALDLAAVVLIAPGLLILGAGVALLIKLGSPGPIFFKQPRIGYRGRRFTIFKFRTMHRDADHGLHRAHTTHLIHSSQPMTKLDANRDPRLIPFGGILRATGMDELPQVINILRGDMSLVGPRPCVPYEYEQYDDYQRHRFDAVPGLTGLWQVSGKNRTTFNEMIQLDIAYVEHQSLLLDLRIIFQTIPALVTQAGDTFLSRVTRPAMPHPGSSVPAGH
jgi:lipopolysaccharide/colanic/teichoic acid biosynthesis glycosyltransferase